MIDLPCFFLIMQLIIKKIFIILIEIARFTVAELVVRVLENEDESNIHGFKREVRDICLRHPLYMTKAELALRTGKGQ
jgi:hypothetical protein